MPFVKRKKRPEISSPTNFEHRVHSGFDHDNGVFVGLPSQWNSIINEATDHQKNGHHANGTSGDPNHLFTKTNGTHSTCQPQQHVNGNFNNNPSNFP